MLLTKENLRHITADSTDKTADRLFALPEKVLQFGTGVLLRGLPDYFIDKANKQDIFNGRIVMVKSTSQGDTSDFEKQDHLYTLCIRGFINGTTVKEDNINASVSRILQANNEWNKVLACAANRDISIIISNTTETGICLVNETIMKDPPQSFPGKLLAYLYERFKAFGGSEESGCIIIPTELISNNGDVLKSILLELAKYNNLEEPFVQWLSVHNRFCNSLVDRIVPGKFSVAEQEVFEQEAGYEDKLAIMAEPYCLWAIEGDEKVRQKLLFSEADAGVVITGDITRFKELKLSLLNGTHTFSCALAFLKGFVTVKEAMGNAEMKDFVRQIMYQEITPAISFPIPQAEKDSFAEHVIDRFSNPFIEHKWLSISLNYSAKMKMRNVPLLRQYFDLYKTVPARMALGFAAFLRFVKPMRQEGKIFWGEYDGTQYKIDDGQAEYYHNVWACSAVEEAITAILKNKNLWDMDLTTLGGFNEAVIQDYKKW